MANGKDSEFGYLTINTYFGPMIGLTADNRISEETDRLGHWEFEEFIEVMKVFDNYYQKPTGTFIDVGCNIGAFMLPLARRFSNEIIGFDCQLPLIDAANKTFRINDIKNARAFCHIITDRTQEISVSTIDYTHPANLGSYELEPPYQNSDSNVQIKSVTSETTVTKTLDSLVSNDVCFIKIDVEGMEHKVLAGAQGIIRRSRPFLTLENHKTDFNSVCDMLYSMDYHLETTVREMAVFIPKGKKNL